MLRATRQRTTIVDNKAVRQQGKATREEDNKATGSDGKEENN
jgi:hypothetical protein